MTKKPYFNKHERDILALLYKERRPLSVKEIAETLGISWVTAKKWAKALHEKKLVKMYDE